MSKNLALLGFVLFALAGCDSYNTTPPEQAAATFAAGLGLKLQGAPVCAAIDTDCDDYVTCTLNDDAGHLHSVQCAALKVSFQCIRGFAVGCKLTIANGDTK